MSVDRNYVIQYMQERVGCSLARATQLTDKYLKSDEYHRYLEEQT